jgi:hypothetical protein
MFDFMAEVRETAAPVPRGRRRRKGEETTAAEKLRTRHEATTLDRVRAAMLLQANGATNALRAVTRG